MSTDIKQILILMSTFNGQDYLCEQLDSIFSQVDVQVSVLVRDDGSSDGTVNILKKYEKREKLNWYQGINIKPAQSFCQLIMDCSGEYDYYAYADQDDIWDKEKLYNAIESLKKMNGPALWYCGTNKFDGSRSIEKGYCGLEKARSFETVVFSFSATNGCTMVFNKALLNILRSCDTGEIDMHDSWTHAMCLACGGEIILDPRPLVFYRIHENQVTGNSGGLKNTLYRFIHPNKLRNKTIIRMLTSPYILEEKRELLNLLCDYI